MVESSKAFNPVDEVLDFLMSQPTPEEIAAMRASEAAQARLEYLLDGNRNGILNDAERAELDLTVQLDNLMSRLKARAKLKLAERV